MVNDYFAFGGCFRSEVEFPDLSPYPSSKVPDWNVQVSNSALGEPGELEGVREFADGWALELYRLRSGLRLEYGATGSYEVLETGRRLVWHPGQDQRQEIVRAVILGPLMALALHESGTLCLHGSAVEINGVGIGFLAPKGYGKSTLAAALAAVGGRLMSDDLLAVSLHPSPELLPGVHSVRMWDDVSQVILNSFPGANLRDGWKKTLTNLPSHRLGWERVPLDTIYLIIPVEDEDGKRVGRTRIESTEAALALARNTKLTDDLVGYREAGRMLRWIAELVSMINIYRLELPRNLEMLPHFASEILSWHSAYGSCAR